MKKYILLGFLTLSTAYSFADMKAKYNDVAFPEEEVWSEAKLPLPPFPDLDSQKWQEFYVTERYQNQAYLYPASLSIGKDGTIRYVLNIKTRNGVDNLSAEGIRCTDRQNKIFAYGDTIGREWIANRRADWASIDTSDQVRLQIRYIFCQEGLPRDHEGAVKRLIEVGGKDYKPVPGRQRVGK